MCVRSFWVASENPKSVALGDFDARGESVAGGGGEGSKKVDQVPPSGGNFWGKKMHAFFQVFFGGNTVYRSLIAVVNQCEFLFGTGLRKKCLILHGFCDTGGQKRSWDIKGG